MKTTPEHDARVAKMKFSTVYPQYVNKGEKKRKDQRRITSGDRMVDRF